MLSVGINDAFRRKELKETGQGYNYNYKVHTVCLRVTVIENGQDGDAPRNECKCIKIRLENTTENTFTLYLFYPTDVDGACY